MLVRDIDPLLSPLESRIIRDLWVVAPDTLVGDAIAQMIDTEPGHANLHLGAESAACAVVVENGHILGLVAERDVLRLTVQGNSLNTLTMGQMMTPLAIALRESDITHATIEQMAPLENAARQLRHKHLCGLPVVDDTDRLVGFITREGLQHVLTSLAWSQRVDRLESHIAQLEAEKADLFEDCVVDVEQRVVERTATICARAEREELLSTIAKQIRSSLETHHVLNYAVREVRSLLKCDRVIIYKLQADFNGVVVAESILDSQGSVLHSEVHDPCVSPEWIEPYRQGQIRAVNDVYAEALTLCHQEMLLGFDIRAKLITPIVVEENLWGLMIASYRDRPYTWPADEIELVQQISVHVAIALKHATTYQQLQAELEVRDQTEHELERSETHQRALISALPDLMMRVNSEGICLEFVPSSNIHILGDFKEFVGSHVSKDLPPEAAQKRLEVIQQALQTGEMQVYEHDLSTDTRVQIEEVRVVPYKDHEALLLVRDISDRKQAELALRQSEAQSQAILAAIPDYMFCLGADGVYRRIVRASREVDFFAAPFSPVGLSMTDIVPADIAERHLYHAEQALRTGELQLYEQRIQIGDRLQDEEVRIVKSGDDEVLFMIRDITDRKQAEAALRQSEQTNRIIIDTLPDLLIQMNREGRYSLMLGGSTVHVKYPSESVTEPGIYDVLPRDMADKRIDYANRAIETGSVQLYEQLFDDDGDLRCEEVRIAPLNDDEVLVIIRDVTDRKQAEQELQHLNLDLEAKIEARTAELSEREARYRALVEVIPDLMIRLRIDGTYLDVVTGDGVKLLNPAQTCAGGNIYDVLPFEQAQQRMFYVQQALQTRDVQFYDYELAVEGDVRSEETRVIAINDEEVLVIVRDITERKRAEAKIHRLLHQTQLLNRISAEMRDSLNLDIILQNLVRAIAADLSADICLFAWYRESDSSDVLEVVTEQKASHLPSWLGRYPLDTFPTLCEHILSNHSYQIDHLNPLDDTSLQLFLEQMGIATYFCLPIHTVSGKIGSLQIGRISPRRAWQDEEIELLKGIGTQVAIAIYQAQLYEESKAKTKKLKQSYQELKDAQLQLVQSEKMSSLGQLVAGIAHEINNPISFVYGNLAIAVDYASTLSKLIHLYQESYPEPPEAIASLMQASDTPYILEDFPKLLKSMETGAVRIRNIVKSLRTFSRLDQADYKAVDIHENIEDTLVILQNRLNGRAGNPEIQVVRNYGDLPPIECYTSLLNQVFMNLLVNAIDAIEERQEELNTRGNFEHLGCITITTASSEDKAIILIRDNGMGMNPETQARIFNPFFTTKPIGLGTGMGLSISYQIITGNHQGNLSCRSVFGEGTEFTLELWQSIAHVTSPALEHV
ncbi:MAG: PAS domain-containing protein [Elainellaceae cyanobacterium]